MIPKEKRFFNVLVWSALLLTALIALSLLLPAVFNFINAKKASSAPDSSLKSDVFRLHIVANSDSPEDQRIKLAVRDAVLDYEKENTNAANAANSEEAEKILMANGAGLLNAARTVLKKEGAAYDAQLVIGNFDFPDKKYGDKTYPAGKYRALRILLGKGEGKNWWCVMFPPLCIIDARNDTITDGNTVKFDSFFVKLWHFLFGGRLEKEPNREPEREPNGKSEGILIE